MNRSRDALRAITVALLALVSVGLPAMFSTHVLHPFSSPKLVVLVLASLVAAVGLCVGVFAGSPGPGPGTALAGSAILAAFVALGTSPLFAISFWGQPNQEFGVVAMAAVLLLAVYSSSYALLPPNTVWLRWLPILVPTALAVLAIAQKLGIPFPVLFQPDPDGRPFLTLGNPIHLGLLLGAASVYAGIKAGLVRGKERWSFLGVCALCIAGMALSETSSSLVAVAIATLCVVGLRQRWQGKRWLLAAVGLGLVGAVAYGLYRLAPNLGVLHVFATGGGARASLHGIAARTIASHPLTGVGPSNFRSALSGSLTPELVQQHYAYEIASDAHSWPLELAATYGLPFALLFGAFVIGGLVRRRGWSSNGTLPYLGAALVLVIGYLFQPLSLSTLPMIAFYAGLGWRADLCGPEVERIPALSSNGVRRTAPAKTVARALAVLAALIAVGLCFFGVRLAITDFASRQADLAGDSAAALAVANGLQPGAVPPYLVAARLAAFEARFQSKPEAVSTMDRALRKAQSLDPGDPITEINWAINLQVLEQHQQAIGHLQTALTLYPGWPLALKGIAFSYLELGREDEARAILEPLVASFPGDQIAKELLEKALSNQSP